MVEICVHTTLSPNCCFHKVVNKSQELSVCEDVLGSLAQRDTDVPFTDSGNKPKYK